MAIVQKLVIDRSKTNNYQIILRDDTGLYNPSNLTGYGGDNGNPVNSFLKYIFDLKDLLTGQTYRQIQSDNINNPDEYYNPSLERIANKENITIDSENFNLDIFNDSVYKLESYLVINQIYEGDGFIGTDVINNVSGAESLYNNYDGIFVDGEVYLFRDLTSTILILDRNIEESFNSFYPILKTSTQLLLSDNLEDCLNKKIAQTASNCDCIDNKNINVLSELQIILWGLNRAVDKEDYLQASDYLKLAKNLCKSSNCDC